MQISTEVGKKKSKTYEVSVDKPFDGCRCKCLVTIDYWLVFFGFGLEVIGDCRLGVLVCSLFVLPHIVGQHGVKLILLAPFSVASLDKELDKERRKEKIKTY